LAFALKYCCDNRDNKNKMVPETSRLISGPQQINFNNMKKFFTLIAATVLTVASFAADHRPVVTLQSSRNYQVVIDGQTIFSRNGIMDLSGLRRGSHSIKVFEMNRGIGFGGFSFGRMKRLVDASTFFLGNNDVDINVDFRGRIRIIEDRYGRDQRDHDWNNGRDRDYGHDRSQDNRDWNRNF
jgi:hypothetical protein